MEKVKFPLRFTINQELPVDPPDESFGPTALQMSMQINEISKRKKKERGYAAARPEVTILDDQWKVRMTETNRLSSNNNNSRIYLATETSKLKNGFQQSGIKNSMRHHKLFNLTKQFVNKLRKNSIYRQPIDYQPFSELGTPNQAAVTCLESNQSVYLAYLIIKLLNNIVGIFLATMILTFSQSFQTNNIIYSFSGFNILWCLLQIFLKSQKITKKQPSTSYCKYINQILFKDYLFMEFSILIIHCLALTLSISITPYLYGYYFCKIPSCLQKIKTLQVELLDKPYLHSYWKLSKIVVTNLILAHLISIAFMLMARNEDVNWMQKKDLQNLEWYNQYIWAYYWATTTMLTVGFGDISPATTRECIVLIVVETLGCMTLAYNINRIGQIMNSIQQKQNQKERGLNFIRKFYHESDKKHEGNLQTKLKKHIQQTFQIQTKHNFEQFDNFVQKLPLNLKQQFLREAHHKIIISLPFIKDFTIKTTQALAEKLILRIAHPQQIICHPKMESSIMILKQGEMSFCADLERSNFSKVSINKIVVVEKDNPILLSLDFLKNCNLRKFNIKSLKYSIYCEIGISDFEAALKQKDVDFELYFSLKHKFQTNQEEFEIINCQFCPNRNHTKFDCPRLHYIPLSLQVVNRHLHQFKTSKNIRMPMKRIKIKSYPYFNYINIIQDEIATSHKLSSHTTLIENEEQTQIVNNFLNNQLRPAHRKRQSRFSKRHSKRESNNLPFNVTQLLKKQMRSYMNGLLHQQEEFEFWDIETDKAHDYKSYFKKFNPSKIVKKSLKKSKSIKKNI